MSSTSRISHPALNRRRLWLALLCLSTASTVGALGCSQDLNDSGSDEASLEVASLSGTDVLGFEKTAGWTVSSGTVSSSTAAFTQGAAALAVTAPKNYTTLVSAKLKSGLAPLAGLTNVGATVEVDMELPSAQPNPKYFGALQLYVSCPSRGVYNQFLGQSELTGQQLSTFQTYSFAVTDFVRTKLVGATFSDLTFTLALNAPAGATGKYIFDNLRTTSPATVPVGSRPSVNLTALLSQSPKTNTPGTASFATGTIQIPASFHVKVGSAGTGTALFALGMGSTTSVSCTYKASSDQTGYAFSSCSTGNVAGDIVAANFAKLTIQSANPAAPLTKIKAQLAYDVLGDQVGTKLVPPIPTFWGETASQITAISRAFAQAEINAPAPPVHRFMSLPIPSFALRQGDGSPVNVLNGAPPPTPSDPPFHFKGDLNNSSDGSPSGLFDGYYEVSGNVSTDDTNQRFTSHFDMTAAAGAAVLGSPIEALRAEMVIDTDNGGTNAFGSVNPTTTGFFRAFLFGQQFEDDPVTVTSGVHLDPSLDLDIDAPPIPVWFFTIEAGVSATAGVDISGSVALNGFQLAATPHASISAHVFGGVDIGVASGGLDTTIQLIGVQIPITAQLTLDISTDPAICAATIDFDLNGQVLVSSGGGEVDLVATIGICPFCWDGSLTIFSWGSVPLTQKAFPAPFPVHLQLGPKFPLGFCALPLDVIIDNPLPNETVIAGVNVGAAAEAHRPATSGQTVGDLIDCQFLTWSSSDLTATFDPSPIGCTPVVTFGPTTGGTTQTLTVNVKDAFNETGSKTVQVNVASLPAGLVLSIISPLQNSIPIVHDTQHGVAIPITGRVTGGSGPLTAKWTSDVAVVAVGSSGPATNDLGTVPFTGGTNVPVNAPTSFLFLIGPQRVTLTVTDAMGNMTAKSVTFNPIIIK